jgi:hypothetical protein
MMLICVRKVFNMLYDLKFTSCTGMLKNLKKTKNFHIDTVLSEIEKLTYS